ncbi:MAG: hypothetical protein A4E27_01648 [Methanobacterium sp. PtaU1.Bin242]|nr:MAG: hypothetical protein A4E27_01648 [Methanobacterium sp. PtaU1.Bin242]
MEDTYQTIRKHKWKIILSFGLAAFIIFAITIVVGIGDIINILSHANWFFILLNFLLEGCIIVVWTIRWKLILGVVGEFPGFKSLTIMLLASIFGNNVTPGAAGGEPLRAYLLREVNGTPFEIGLASSTADRVFEFFPFVIISVFAAFLILSWNIPIWTRIIVFILISISLFFFMILLYAVWRKEISQRVIISLTKPVYPFFVKLVKSELTLSEVNEKIVYYINRFSHGFLQVVKDRKIFIIGFILSFMMWGMDIVRFYVCFIAIGSYPPLMPLVIIYTVGILISLVPLLPGSWGIREATIVGLFAVVGVAGDVVISASLIDRVASYIAPTILGAFGALYYGRHIRNSKKAAA